MCNQSLLHLLITRILIFYQIIVCLHLAKKLYKYNFYILYHSFIYFVREVMQTEIKIKYHTRDVNQLDSTCVPGSMYKLRGVALSCHGLYVCVRARLHDRYSEKDMFLRERGRQCNPTAWSPVKVAEKRDWVVKSRLSVQLDMTQL